MEYFRLQEDMLVMCLEADRFPEGIWAAHHRLHSIVSSEDRMFFGISFPKRGKGIVYLAAAEAKNRLEIQELELESFVIPKGKYVTQMVYDYFKCPEQIADVFQNLLQCPSLDPNGVCIEWYLGNRDLRCMVRVFS